MAKLDTSALLEISPERQKIIIEDRERLITGIEELKILLPTDKTLQSTIDKAERALEQVNAIFKIMVKRNPALADTPKK